MGCPIRKSTDHCSYAAPRSLSQLYTSFIASVCLGIHRVPLVCFYYMVCTASPPATYSYSCYWFIVGQMGTNHIWLPWRSTHSLKSKKCALLSFAAHIAMRRIRPITIAILLHHVKEPPRNAGVRVYTDACAGLQRPATYILNNLIKNLVSLRANRLSYFTTHYLFVNYLKIPVELRGFEPRTPCLQSRCSSQLSYSPSVTIVGLGGLEPPTSRLSGVRSNHLSYKPPYQAGLGCRRSSPAAASV